MEKKRKGGRNDEGRGSAEGKVQVGWKRWRKRK